MSDKRKLQHESIIGLINYSVMCAKSCDVLKTHDDTLTQNEQSCLSKLINLKLSSQSCILFWFLQILLGVCADKVK